jgi:hypothetical protein
MDASQFSNPRQAATIDNWPVGFRGRTTAKFEVETDPKKGQRVSRVTQNKTKTGWNEPHKTTYADKFVIVDGDDGKTYLLASSKYGHIVIWQSDMKHTAESIGRDDPRYADFLRLFQ